MILSTQNTFIQSFLNRCIKKFVSEQQRCCQIIKLLLLSSGDVPIIKYTNGSKQSRDSGKFVPVLKHNIKTYEVMEIKLHAVQSQH
jgi:hypothetical protein